MSKPKPPATDINFNPTFEHLDEIQEHDIGEILWRIEEGNHDPKEGQLLLKYFLKCTDRGVPGEKAIPELLLGFLRTAFESYLREPGPGQLERALGLVRSKKRPVIRTERHDQIAHAVLQERLRGRTFDEANSIVGTQFSISPGRVGDIWGKRKDHAHDRESLTRIFASEDGRLYWTPEEERRLQQLYGPKP